jgi:hypothetical protein
MATIYITGIILHALDDPTDRGTWNAGVKLTPRGGTRGTTRVLLNGRVRRIGMSGRTDGISISIPRISRTDREWLRDHEGVIMVYRDGRGRLFFGAYETSAGPDAPGVGYGSAEIEFAAITHSIEV